MRFALKGCHITTLMSTLFKYLNSLEKEGWAHGVALTFELCGLNVFVAVLGMWFL